MAGRNTCSRLLPERCPAILMMQLSITMQEKRSVHSMAIRLTVLMRKEILYLRDTDKNGVRQCK